MSSDSSGDEIAHLAHHVAAPEFWDRLARATREWLGANSLILVEHDPANRRGRISHEAGLFEPFHSLYGARYAAQNPWLAGMTARGDEVMTGVEILPSWELVRLDFYKAWLRPQAAFHALLGIIERRPDRVRCLIAFRAADGKPFGSEDKRRMAAILPHFGCACEIEERIASDRRDAALLTSLFDRLPQAIFLVDAGSRPRLLNRPAQMLLDRRDPLLLAGGILTAASAEAGRALRRQIEAVSGGAAAHGEVTLSSAGEAPLVLGVAPLPAPVLDLAGAAQAVVMVSTGPLALAATSSLCAFYNLTPAEARLAAMIAGGRTLIEAASRLRVSHNTARTHMKRIYAKTETHRQSELVRLLAAGLAPPP